MSNCEPWTNHLDHTALSHIELACKNACYDIARGFVAIGDQPSASQHCLKLAEMAIEMLAKENEAVVDSTIVMGD